MQQTMSRVCFIDSLLSFLKYSHVWKEVITFIY